MSNKLKKVWQVIHEFDESISETPLISTREHKSIGYAIDYFHPDEVPEKVIEAQDGLDDAYGHLWITNKRVLFIGQRSLMGKKPVYKEFLFESITSVNYTKKLLEVDRLFLNIPTVSAAGHVAQIEFKIEPRRREKAQLFAGHIQQIINSLHTSQTTNESKNNEIDFVKQLEYLSKLKSQGHISEDEFQAAKRKLLGI